MPFQSPIKFIRLLNESFKALKRNDPLRMAAATAFFTTFALPAILIILIQTLGLVFNRRTISNHLFAHLADILGDESVSQIRQTSRGFLRLAKNKAITLFGFIFLVFVATTLFKVIKGSLNQLWNINVYPSKHLSEQLLQRAISVAVIGLAGILFLAVLLAEGLQAVLRDYINEIWPGSGSLLFAITNQVLSVTIVTIWFALLFKFASDGRPSWRITMVGALFTGILFTAGKLLLGWLLGFSNIHNIYGASGSFVLVLLFVFYCSFILYYGAMFTRVWAEYKGSPIEPGKNAYKYELSEIKKIEGR
jgi:membrane protein